MSKTNQIEGSRDIFSEKSTRHHSLLDQCCNSRTFCDDGNSLSVLSIMVAMWLLSTCHVASATEGLNISFPFTLINLNLNNLMKVVATVLDGVVLDNFMNIMEHYLAGRHAKC